MTTPESLARRNYAVNGSRWLLSKCAEECAELGAAILKYLNKDASEEDIQAEMADVEIAIETLSAAIYGRETIEKYKRSKIKRIERKVSEQEGEKPA